MPARPPTVEQIAEIRLGMLRMLAIVQLAGQLLVFVYVMWYIRNHAPALEDQLLWRAWAAGGVLVGLTLGATIVIHFRLPEWMARHPALPEAIETYFRVSLLQSSLAGGTALFCLVSVMWGADEMVMLSLWLVATVCQIAQYPSSRRLANVYAEARRRYLEYRQAQNPMEAQP